MAQQQTILAAVFGVIFAILAVFLISMFTAPPPSTGQAGSTGDVQLNVAGELGIEVVPPYDVTNFGSMVRDSEKNTLPTSGNTLLPLKIRNNGNVVVDVETCASDPEDPINRNIWKGTAVPADYQFLIADRDPRPAFVMDNCAAIPCFNPLTSRISPTPMPVTCPTGTLAIDNLQWTDSNDEAAMHFGLHVPADEPAGEKSSTVTVVGVASSTYSPTPGLCNGPGQRIVNDPSECTDGAVAAIPSSSQYCCTTL